MNTRNRDPDHAKPTFDEREWQAQEAALHAERIGVAAAGDDPSMARYRSVSRALRHPLADAPPADFAESLARQVVARQKDVEERFEKILLRVLSALLGLSGGITCVLYGREWVAAMTRGISGDVAQWTTVIVACAAMHWALDQWRARSITR